MCGDEIRMTFLVFLGRKYRLMFRAHYDFTTFINLFKKFLLFPLDLPGVRVTLFLNCFSSSFFLSRYEQIVSRFNCGNVLTCIEPRDSRVG